MDYVVLGFSAICGIITFAAGIAGIVNYTSTGHREKDPSSLYAGICCTAFSLATIAPCVYTGAEAFAYVIPGFFGLCGIPFLIAAWREYAR